ncbi:hypothetical protein [Actinomadura kijaniata]|uniref:hypothetical protein n=1 Tax=Actinomadura kijaniata TaxID=46161 RepID=UPI00082F1F23|nr:hypothetical protein [Actinomadura kijaniata]
MGTRERGEGYFFPRSPNLFWPADRAWCVAIEVGLDSTHVGGSAGLVADLLADPRFEALPAAPDDRIDEVNQADSDERGPSLPEGALPRPAQPPCFSQAETRTVLPVLLGTPLSRARGVPLRIFVQDRRDPSSP